LPPEYRFDVEKATRSLQTLAESQPDAPISLTLAQIGDDGLEGESEVRTTAAGAAALLATVGEDQSLKAAGKNLYVLRVTRAEELPPPPPEESW
jgi:hypothetical protein